MKVIFLDVDGVLNSAEGYHRDKLGYVHYLQRECMDRLSRIAEALPDVKFVLSSSWRFSTPYPDFRRLLVANKVYVNLVSQTPLVTLSGSRGVEIGRWLKENPGVKDFVILDDSSDMGQFKKKLVQTSWEKGLQDEHVDEVIRRLGGSAH